MGEPAERVSIAGGIVAGVYPFPSRAILQCRERDRDAVAAEVSIVLPAVPCRSTSQDGIHALWLGPEEWLILAEEGTPCPLARLFERLDSQRYSVVDIGSRHAGYEIVGQDAAHILQTGCPLDLDLDVFPVGTCTRTLFYKAEIILWRREEARFHMEVTRSFATYFRELVGDSIRDATV